MAAIVAKRLVRHLERVGCLGMKKPPLGGTAAAEARAASVKPRNKHRGAKL
jgi:hypothetical protein